MAKDKGETQLPEEATKTGGLMRQPGQEAGARVVAAPPRRHIHRAQRAATSILEAEPNIDEATFKAKVKAHNELAGLSPETVLLLISIALTIYKMVQARKANAAAPDPLAVEGDGAPTEQVFTLLADVELVG